MSSDKTVTERRVYTFIDWAGEVGGFNRFVQLVFTFILPFVQVWSLDKHLISRPVEKIVLLFLLSLFPFFLIIQTTFLMNLLFVWMIIFVFDTFVLLV